MRRVPPAGDAQSMHPARNYQELLGSRRPQPKVWEGATILL